MCLPGRTLALVISVGWIGTPVRGADQTLYPVADGTIVDGGTFGVRDGNPDRADWYFNESSFDGVITLSRFSAAPIEQRVIFEFDLRNVSLAAPVTATLTFSLRGTTRFPAESAPVALYVYPANAAENLSDFSAGPASLVMVASVAPFQPKTAYRVNVSRWVNEMRSAQQIAIGFRTQIDAQSPHAADQAFMDVLDSDVATKPVMRITDRVPGDFNQDRLVNRDDFSILAACLDGPEIPVPSTCTVCDLDFDSDVDMYDVGSFLEFQTLYRP